MGFIEVFNIKLSDFHNALTLKCGRDFSGVYFLESETFRVQLMRPENFAAVRQLLRTRAAVAKARSEEMKPGPVWTREGVIEIGIGEGDAIYVQAGGMRVEPPDDQVERLTFALARVQSDYADVARADHARPPPPNYDAARRRGFFFTDPFTGELW